MKIIYNCDGVIKELEVSDFYYEIAKLLIKEPETSNHEVTVSIVDSPGEVVYLITKRSGTRFIREVCNSLPQSLSLTKEEVFLTCVDPEVNAYKFYKLTPRGNEVKASYGRMGTNKGELFGERSYVYPLSMYWVKYFEKIGKGYIDRSDVYLRTAGEKGEKKPDAVKAEQQNTVSAILYAKLTAFAKKAIREAKVKVPITPAIIEYSKEKIDALRAIAVGEKNVDSFNRELLELISVLQRPVKTGSGDGVKRLLAVDERDFRSIIERETDLIAAMEGSSGHKLSAKDFGCGIEVFVASEKQKAEVLNKLSDSLKGKVKEIYRVIPQGQKRKFDNYLKKNNIKVVKRFWHGSRNENWASIIKNGLQLNPNAVITGKMFGQGIYFAPSSMKSWNYTSYKGTSWAKGRSDTAFMGLYATAYGTPYDVYSYTGTDFRADTKRNKCNCLHAHAGSMLHNDEIVFYDEDSILLQYIVEFE